MLTKTYIIKVFLCVLDESTKPDILFDFYICSNKTKALRTYRYVCYIFLAQRQHELYVASWFIPLLLTRVRKCKTPPTLAKRLLTKLMIVHMQGKGYAVGLGIGEHPLDWHMNHCTVAVILAIVVVRVDVICCQLIYFSSVIERTYWSSCDIVRTFRSPAVIRRLHSDSAPRQLCLLPLVVTSLITARRDAPQQIMVRSCNQRHTRALAFMPGKIFNSPEFLRHFEEKRVGEFCRAVVLFQKVPKNIGKFFLNF